MAYHIKINNHNHEIGGSQWIETAYSKYHLEQNCKEKSTKKHAQKYFSEIHSKDQGRA